jgi:tRNA A-37 threonylcarbamoyl transferase component Bud32/Cdc6-like AAA superfamily ATPase
LAISSTIGVSAEDAPGDLIVRVQLSADFSYVHGPLRDGGRSMPVLGVPALTEAIKRRLRHSNGGTFLVTGFRGVGKTSLVLRALDELARTDAFAGVELIPVVLNVAKPLTANELFYAIVRRLFEALEQQGLFGRLDQQVRRALLQAYLRTSLTVKETRSDSLERAAGVGLGGGLPGGSAHSAGFNALAPKLNLSRKRTQSLALEASFLTYSATDVEHDVLRIIELLMLGLPPPKPALRRRLGLLALWLLGWQPALRRRLRSSLERPAPTGPRPIRVVVVLDEFDKLTATEQGNAVVDELLTAMKNVLTASGAHFIVVGGLDLHDKALRDSRRGNSVFESVFGWQLYVSCLWDGPDELLSALVLQPGSGYDGERDELEMFRRYLRFKARGITRRLFQEFNAFVTWDGDAPLLDFDEAARKRIVFYGELETVLQEFFGRATHGESPFALRIDEDRWRMGSYYVTDWILRSEGRSFKFSEIIGATAGEELDPLLQVSTSEVERLVHHLIERGIVEFDRRPGPSQTVIGDVSQAQEPSYRLASRILRLLHGFAQESESERADLDAFTSIAPAQRPGGLEAGADAPARAAGDGPDAGASVDDVVGRPPLRKLRHGRYVLQTRVAQGGLGEVWSAFDNVLRRKVAVKIIHESIAAEPTARDRFAREARITTGLNHPFIVRAFDYVDEVDGPPALVMEFVEGRTLREVLQHDGPLRPQRAVRIAEQLLSALEFLHRRGIERLDLKPSNIMIRSDPEWTPVIIDLGIARDDADDGFSTLTRVFIGTPAYVAPEQLSGGRVDIRADLYSFALVVMEMLGDRPAGHGGSIAEILVARAHADVDVTGTPGSDQLRALLARALRRDPAERFATPEAMLEALRQVPEYEPPRPEVADTDGASGEPPPSGPPPTHPAAIPAPLAAPAPAPSTGGLPPRKS